MWVLALSLRECQHGAYGSAARDRQRFRYEFSPPFPLDRPRDGVGALFVIPDSIRNPASSLLPKPDRDTRSVHAARIPMERLSLSLLFEEGDPREPVHVHVSSPGAKAKFWLFPEVELAYNRGYDARTIKRLLDVIEKRRGEIEEFWNDYFA